MKRRESKWRASGFTIFATYGEEVCTQFLPKQLVYARTMFAVVKHTLSVSVNRALKKAISQLPGNSISGKSSKSKS